MIRVLSLSVMLLAMCLQSQAQRGYIRSAIQRDMEEKHGKPQAKKGEDWVNNKLLNVDLPNAYDFTGYYLADMTSYKKGQAQKTYTTKYYFNTKSAYYGMAMLNEKKKNVEEMLTVYDMNKNAMVTLDLKEKTGTAINLDALKGRNHNPNQPVNDRMKCQQKSDTRTILGEKCVLWVCEDKDANTRSEMWITSSAAPVKYNPLGGTQTVPGSLTAKGWLLAFDSYKNNEKETSFEVKELNKQSNRVEDLSQYKFVQKVNLVD